MTNGNGTNHGYPGDGPDDWQPTVDQPWRPVHPDQIIYLFDHASRGASNGTRIRSTSRTVTRRSVTIPRSVSLMAGGSRGGSRMPARAWMVRPAT